MKASVSRAGSKTEYGRSAEYVPMGSAMSSPRSCALRARTATSQPACMISVSTFTRLTKEKPQSPRTIDVSQRAVAHGQRIVEAAIGAQILSDLRGTWGLVASPRTIARRQGEMVKRTRRMPKDDRTAISRRRMT